MTSASAGGAQDCLFDGLRKLHGDKIVLGIEIVLARFVDDPKWWSLDAVLSEIA